MASEMSDFYCVYCGTKGIPIWRKKGRAREAGHLKKIWCLHCKKETNHAECKPNTQYTYNDFLFEFNNHNFNEEGNRIKTLKELRRDYEKTLYNGGNSGCR